MRKLFLALIVFAPFFATACFHQGNSRPKEDPARIPASLSLIMGTSTDNPPFNLRFQGKVSGLDTDLAYLIATRLGMNLEIRDMEFSGLIPSLQSGRLDFVMAAVTLTEERKKAIDFSEIYYYNTFALITKKGFSFKDIKDLQYKTLGVQLGSTMEKAGKELLQRIKGLKLLSLGRNSILIEELKAGRVDAILMETVQAVGFVKNYQSLEYFKIPEWGQELVQGYAIAFPKESEKFPGLRAKVNQILQQLKAEGKLKELEAKWLKGPS